MDVASVQSSDEEFSGQYAILKVTFNGASSSSGSISAAIEGSDSLPSADTLAEAASSGMPSVSRIVLAGGEEGQLVTTNLFASPVYLPSGIHNFLTAFPALIGDPEAVVPPTDPTNPTNPTNPRP